MYTTRSLNRLYSVQPIVTGKRTSAENRSWKTAENRGWKQTNHWKMADNLLIPWKTADSSWKMTENIFLHWKIADNFANSHAGGGEYMACTKQNLHFLG